MWLATVLAHAIAAGGEVGAQAEAPSPGSAALPETARPPQRDPVLSEALSAAQPFASEAERLGITVTDGEVAARMGIAGRLYPGQSLSKSQAKRLLLAEKYLAAKRLDTPGDAPEGGRERQLDLSGLAPDEAATARKAAQLEVLLAREDLRKEGSRLEDLAQIRLAEGRRPARMWPLEDMQIKGGADECLAWLEGACFASLGEYNAAAAHFRIPSGVPLDSAKASVLKRYVVEKRVAEKARDPSTGLDPDSILRVHKNLNRGLRWIQSARAFGMPVQDLRTLHSLYGKHYWKLFAAGEEATLGLIGSSDSLYVDSLHKLLAAWKGSRPARPSAAKPAIPEPDLPWATFREEELPRALAAVADSFRVGQFSAPIRTRLGFFIVRLTRLEPREEISFDDAVPRLIFMATREKFLDMDSVLEARARAYYQANKARFALPDTLDMLAWLLPKGPSAAQPAKGRPGSVPPADTARAKPMAMSSLDLGVETRDRLQALARADSPKVFLGPLEDRYGRWHFRLRSRRIARDTLPFRLVRREILDRISEPLPEEGSGLADGRDVDEVLRTLGMAKAVRRQEPDEAGAPGGPKGREEQGVPPAAGMEMKRKEEERLLRTARLDISRLLR